MDRELGAVFRQSKLDFPCHVVLGKNTPSFGLHRFNKGLRFFPFNDEGFTLRGDKKQLLYKGRKRSHRFTILGDTAFEYDCVLEREPDSNVVSLVMEGAENFDFFRQPDFVKEPFLKGSYAVYKKETLVGEGTGKLCQIHRPQIIDARGRRCWGGLSIVNNELSITIPERFLNEAKYPVIVDPVVGTNTVGSQAYYEDYENDLLFECSIPVNRFIAADRIDGLCTAYYYTNRDDGEAGGRPVIFSNNFNQPHLRKSINENLINMRVTGSSLKGWRSGDFRTSEAIAAGTSIWFGLFSEYMWYPRYDYGGVFLDNWWSSPVIPNVYPGYTGSNIVLPSNNFKLSMYFNYINSQNYIRVLTQGVNLIDNKIMKAGYKREMPQTAGVYSLVDRVKIFFYLLQETVIVKGNRKSIVLFIRSIQEKVSNLDIYKNLKVITRRLSDTSIIKGKMVFSKVFITLIFDSVKVSGTVFRGLILFVQIITKLFVRDYLLKRFLVAKTEIKIKSCVVREITLESIIK